MLCNGKILDDDDHEDDADDATTKTVTVQYQGNFVTGPIERRDEHNRFRIRNRTTMTDAAECQIRSSEAQTFPLRSLVVEFLSMIIVDRNLCERERDDWKFARPKAQTWKNVIAFAFTIAFVLLL